MLDLKKLNFVKVNYQISKISANQIIPENIFLYNIFSKNIFSAEINPTDYCNYTCSWCFTNNKRTNNNLDISCLKKYIDLFTTQGGKAIHFSGGGEPLVYKHLYTKSDLFDNKPILDYCIDKGLYIGLITNGTNFLNVFQNTTVYNLAFVRFSIDSVNKSRYCSFHNCNEQAFKNVLKSIDSLVKNRNGFLPAIGISFIVDQEQNLNYSFSDIKEIADFATSLGIDFVQFKHLHSNNAEKAEHEMYKIHQKCCQISWKNVEFWVHHYINPKTEYNCQITNYIEVLCANNVKSPCCHLFGIDKNQKFNCNSLVCRYDSMNTILNNILVDIKKHDNYLKVLENSISNFGFHPFRYFTSSPDLYQPFFNN